MVEVAVEILKARNDKREYRRIVLENSLEVLLISDPDTDKASHSLNAQRFIYCLIASFIYLTIDLVDLSLPFSSLCLVSESAHFQLEVREV